MRASPLLLLLLTAAAVLPAPAQPADAVGPAPAARPAEGAFPWPVAPFHSEHPVRGQFGDPRTKFFGAPTLRTVLSAAGSFSFHQGIDISAPDGTPVYPVMSGAVSLVRGARIRISSSNRVFEYDHLDVAVREGDLVVASETILGRIQRGRGHVHLTELDQGRAVNPLAPGRLTPYTDDTLPEIGVIEVTDSFGTPLVPNLVHGNIRLLASVTDLPSRPVPGAWHDMPVMPAFVTWSVETPGGRTVVGPRVAVDFRGSLPPRRTFWRYYARGTYQNMATFSHHYSYGQPGRYLLDLAHGTVDTSSVPDGVYRLIVTAADIRGNQARRTEVITVDNG